MSEGSAGSSALRAAGWWSYAQFGRALATLALLVLATTAHSALPTSGPYGSGAASRAGSTVSDVAGTANLHVVKKLPPKPAPAARASAAPAFPGVDGTTSQVITVTAPSLSSTSGVMRRWQRDEIGHWRAVGVPVKVDLGSSGLTRTPSDAVPKTPVGTWGLDLVVARDRNVTRMPSHVLAPGDGWSSCVTCADYDRLSTSNELWTGRDTWSRIAIHVVTNPKRVPGRSSGIFIHVSTGTPTQGCVGVPLKTALATAAWLDPKANPRLVVSVGL